MSLPARKLAVAFAAFVSSLFSAAALASAGEPSSPFAAAGLAEEQPLSDREMTALRGGGFVADLSAALQAGMNGGGLVPQAIGAGNRSGAGDWLSALFGGLPAVNLVAAQLNDQPTVMRIGIGPQSLGCGNGLSCPAGMIVDLAASNSGAAGDLSLNIAVAP
ncbi:MAG TPA: hypothetical protein VHA10_11075 [Hypericibacter adhaerens]|jgi:hypothetical protein|uniref:Uncharacterized protein n=1 Tax=Hypericibacter adhaerens TaxID=2602016 RepID=A0A5J6N7W2_9PROT|nr:hypothetical protein [Hypericibacter adhaerens]QEX25003.1 hypothetical protein FRZ61_49470 [Hypericibacter adhaerens]HWA43744.1 hypothetical protein [Hypericibacter adhaerens]